MIDWKFAKILGPYESDPYNIWEYSVSFALLYYIIKNNKTPKRYPRK